MDSTSSSTQSDNRLVRAKRGNQQYLRALQIVSWAITAIFLVALAWAIYQALVNGNSLPLWAWVGVIVLFALAIGLIVAVVVYRGVVDQAGPFDFRPTTHVTGELRTENQRVEAGGASSLSARIHMTEGILGVQGGASDAMNASFIYDNADWKPPVVIYAVDPTGLGNLVVEQQSTGRPAMHQGRCEWDIRLGRELPLDLNVKVGAGKADLKLGGLSLSKLHIESGVGALTVDFSGEWLRSLEAFIKTGIGDTVLRLPRDVGVRIHSAVSMGSAHPQGLTWDGEAHVNAAFGKSPVTLDIYVESGIGKVTYEGS
jgi:hypothetical protein